MMLFKRPPFSGGFNFTEACRVAIAAAREEARQLNHEYVGTEHLLLGLLRQPDPDAERLLRRLNVSAQTVRARLLALLPAGPSKRSSSDRPYTSRAKKALELSMSAARERRTAFVGAEHLLIGLVAEEKGLAAVELRALGVTVDRLLAALGGDAVGADAPSIRIDIDDGADRSIYEQIVAQIQERVAVGEVRGGDRLPTVRQLADQLDIAPGTVARAYSELERLGVIVTEGARGTRVAERKPPSMPAADRPMTLSGLLRPVAVAAFHLGATAAELRAALDEAMKDIFPERDAA
jgi:DNA-binding transcriptional regulator YhcF (GntR family)